QPLLRIEPTLRAERPAVAECALGQHLVNALRLLDHGKAKAVAHAGRESADELARLQLRHRFYTLFREDARIVKTTFVEHRLIEFCQIRAGREQATRRNGMPRAFGWADERVIGEDKFSVFLAV